MSIDIQNINPKLYKKVEERQISKSEEDEDIVDEFDSREVFDLIRNINDPEHPLSLEELNVVDLSGITVDNANNDIKIHFTPTIPHCSMATLIGLSLQVRLIRTLPPRFKLKVEVSPGSHQSEGAINKQLADKERVAAALENSSLMQVIDQCLDVES